MCSCVTVSKKLAVEMYGKRNYGGRRYKRRSRYNVLQRRVERLSECCAKFKNGALDMNVKSSRAWWRFNVTFNVTVEDLFQSQVIRLIRTKYGFGDDTFFDVRFTSVECYGESIAEPIDGIKLALYHPGYNNHCVGSAYDYGSLARRPGVKGYFPLACRQISVNSEEPIAKNYYVAKVTTSVEGATAVSAIVCVSGWIKMFENNIVGYTRKNSRGVVIVDYEKKKKKDGILDVLNSINSKINCVPVDENVEE